MGRRKWDKIRRNRRRAEQEKNRAIGDHMRGEYFGRLMKAAEAMEAALAAGTLADDPDSRVEFVADHMAKNRPPGEDRDLYHRVPEAIQKDQRAVSLMFGHPPTLMKLCRDIELVEGVNQMCAHPEWGPSPAGQYLRNMTELSMYSRVLDRV